MAWLGGRGPSANASRIFAIAAIVLLAPVAPALAQDQADAPEAPSAEPASSTADTQDSATVSSAPATVLVPSPPSTVSFLDARPLTISLDELEADQGITVAVHNDLAADQDLALQIVGLNRASDKKVRTIFDETAVVAEDVGGGSTVRLTLELGPTKEVPAGSYEALLVATGERGSPARVDLTISVEDSSTVPGPGRRNQLAASDVNAVTLSATNYLPSFLAPWAGAVMALAALLLLSVWAASSLLSTNLTRLLIFVAAVAAIIGGSQLFQRDLSKPTSLHAISVYPLPTTGVSNATVGVAQAGDGRLASVEVADNLLRPQHLQAAGVYKGKIDLDSGTDKGNADVSINVRDWWPWAFLTLAAGLGLGYVLRRWFEVERQGRRLRMRIAQIRVEVGQSDLDFERQTEGAFGLYINQRLATRVAAIERLLADEDAAKAQEKLTALDAYVNDFRGMRSRLCDLLHTIEQIRIDWKTHPFGLPDERSIGVIGALEGLKAERLDDPGADDDVGQLKAYKAKIDAQLASARVINRLQTLVVSEVETVGSCEADAEKLKALKADLQAFGQKLLREAEPKLAELTKEYDALVTRIRADCPTADTEIRDGLHLAAMREGSRTLGLDASYITIETVTEVEEKAASEVSIDYSILAYDGPRQDQVLPEDPLVLRIAFSGGDPGYREVSIDLGDDSPPLVRSVPFAEPRVIEIPVKYTREGTFAVRVSAHPDPLDLTLADTVIAVKGKPRLAALTDAYLRTDRALLRTAFVVSVGSGLALLYFVDAGWGEPLDYVKALLWGGVVGEGATVAAALASRTMAKE